MAVREGGVVTWAQRFAVFYRALGLAALLSLCLCCGSYIVAPNGGYDFYANETPSYDWHHFHWIFQGSDEMGAIPVTVIVVAALFFPYFAKFALCAAAIVAFIPPLAGVGHAFLSLRYRWPCLVVAVVGLVLGFIETVRAGVSPGLCC